MARPPEERSASAEDDRRADALDAHTESGCHVVGVGTIGKGFTPSGSRVLRDLDPLWVNPRPGSLLRSILSAFLPGLRLNFSLTLTCVQPDDLAGD